VTLLFAQRVIDFLVSKIIDMSVVGLLEVIFTIAGMSITLLAELTGHMWQFSSPFAKAAGRGWGRVGC
jgi:hypothetical protein